MSGSRKHSKEAPSIESLSESLSALRKVVTLLVLVCVVISACLNAYLIYQNMHLKEMLEVGDSLRTLQTQRADHLQFILEQVRMELQAGSKDNEQVKEILGGLEARLSEFLGTGVQTAPVP
jgi:hypothetical protein